MEVSYTKPTLLPVRGPRVHQNKQAPFIRPAQMSLFARVSCYPPLAQVSCPQRLRKALELGKDDTLRFTVVIESSSVFPEQPWEVQIWHNIHSIDARTTASANESVEWTALSLHGVSDNQVPLLSDSQTGYQAYRCVFTEELALPAQGGHAKFTVRYRTGPNAQWQWVNDQQRGMTDGELVFVPRDTTAPVAIGQTTQPERAQLSAKDELGKYLDDLSSELEVESRMSEAPNSTLWQVSGTISAASDTESSTKEVVLGIPTSVVRYFTLVRIWTPWLGPRHGRNQFRVTEEAVLCSFLRSDGSHLVLLGVSGVDNVLTVFGSGERGEVVVKAQSDNTESTNFEVLASVATDFEVAMSAVIYEARKKVRVIAEGTVNEASPSSYPQHGDQRRSSSGSSTSDDLVLVEKDPKVQWMTQWYDGLTYCTWNGVGQDLTEKKLLHALDDLKAHGINVANLIIDDNWQALDNDGEPQFQRRWTQFEGNPRAFPGGLKQTIQAIRQRQPSIQHIAVWHALFGYWGGISPTGDLAQRFKTKEVLIKNPETGGPISHAFDRGSLLAIEPDDIQKFYEEFYSYLESVGIDSVKTDAQFFLDLLQTPEDRRRFFPSYLDAWSIAALKHFSTRSISCMSTFPQAIFHSQLPTNKPNILLRNSDDFFPEVRASHRWHIFCNAHNALLTRFLNVLPDWDMFQTSHPYASFHAAARCISGGPIHITDEPGNHNASVIDQMTAPTTHGTTVILRPSIPGRAMEMYHDYKDGNVLTIGTYTGWAGTGSGILGLFNIQDSEVSRMVSLREFPGIYQGSTGFYIVRAHTSGRVTDLMRPYDNSGSSGPAPLVMIELENKGWEILTAYPTQSFTLKGSHGCDSGEPNLTHVAVLGLLGKMTGVAAVASSDVFVAESGRLRFDISLKALGTLGIYFSNLQDHSIEKNFMVMISGKPVPRRTVWKEGGEEAKVLAVDVLSAWKEMSLDSGWGNEAIVQVFFG